MVDELASRPLLARRLVRPVVGRDGGDLRLEGVSEGAVAVGDRGHAAHRRGTAADPSGTDRTSTELRVRIALSSAGVRPAMSRRRRARGATDRCTRRSPPSRPTRAVATAGPAWRSAADGRPGRRTPVRTPRSDRTAGATAESTGPTRRRAPSRLHPGSPATSAARSAIGSTVRRCRRTSRSMASGRGVASRRSTSRRSVAAPNRSASGIRRSTRSAAATPNTAPAAPGRNRTPAIARPGAMSNDQAWVSGPHSTTPPPSVHTRSMAPSGRRS